MRASLIPICFAASIGCSPASYDYSGYRTYKHFPLDERQWLYINSEEDHNMKVWIDSTELSNNTEVKTLRYENVELQSAKYWIKWSSDSRSGVQIHGYMLENPTDDSSDGDDEDTGAPAGDAVTGSWVNYDPPVTVTSHQMAPGEEVISDANGVTYTSTFAAIETCPNNWQTQEDWTCLKIVIDSDEAEPPPFVGTWHWADAMGTSRFQPKGAPQPWILEDLISEWSGDE